MAGKTKEMSQIKQLLLLKKAGVSNRKAASIVGMNKETVNNYMKKVNSDALGIDGLLFLDDPVLEQLNEKPENARNGTLLDNNPGDTPGGLPVVKRRPATSHPGGEGQQDAKSELPSCEEGTLPLPGLHLGGNL